MEKSMMGAVMAIVGGVLGVIGSFGAWVTVSFMGMSINAAGVDGDGKFTLLLAIAAAITGGLSMKYYRKQLGIATTALGGLIVIVPVIDMLRAAEVLSSVSGAGLLGTGVDAGLGWGIYLTLVAGVIALAGGILIMLSSKAAAAPAKKKRR